MAWLREAAWPLWIARGIDHARGGFHEQLSLEDATCTAPFRRLRVAARQVYVFAEAHEAGVTGADAAVELGIRFLRNTALGADGGYARRFDLDGAVIDDTRDLYDQAFVLLALASAAKVMPAPALQRQALALLRYLDTHFTHPAGGYAESLPPALPRRQNPHMHLLEACLACAEAFGDALFLTRANDMLRLFRDRLFDPATGTLPEYFDEDWTVRTQAGRHVVEPGHHCEWVWLLHWAEALGCDVPSGISVPLLRFMDRTGNGILRDEIWSDGAVKSPGSRLWPQTERLKAEALRPDATPARLLEAHAGLRRFLDPAPRGLWVERLTEGGMPEPGPAPASSLYHLTAGILVSYRHGGTTR